MMGSMPPGVVPGGLGSLPMGALPPYGGLVSAASMPAMPAPTQPTMTLDDHGSGSAAPSALSATFVDLCAFLHALLFPGQMCTSRGSPCLCACSGASI